MTDSPFTQAQADIQTLSKKPGNDVLLKLYALYKQGSEGDVTGKRPGGFDFVGGAKYDAWEAQKGKSQADAQAEYVTLVQDLKAKDQ
jgi:acyl-CoA-binding protein